MPLPLGDEHGSNGTRRVRSGKEGRSSCLGRGIRIASSPQTTQSYPAPMDFLLLNFPPVIFLTEKPSLAGGQVMLLGAIGAGQEYRNTHEHGHDLEANFRDAGAVCWPRSCRGASGDRERLHPEEFYSELVSSHRGALRRLLPLKS